MKVRLTEQQVELIKFLNEQTDFVEKSKDAIKNVKDAANKLYNIITFTTIAEIRDGDTDISVIEQRVEKLDDSISTISSRVSSFYDRFSEEEYYAKKMDDIHLELENRITTVNRKVMALGYLVDQLKPLARVNEYGEGRDVTGGQDWDTPFDDITPTEI